DRTPESYWTFEPACSAPARTRASKPTRWRIDDRANVPRKGSFKNIKLGKNVYRQMKRRGAPQYSPPPQKEKGKKQDNKP
ncbi:MAG: hypothetical protein DMG09_27840, partial [Acidobacteria bacterium]